MGPSPGSTRPWPDPRHANALYQLGSIAEQGGRRQEACSYYTKAFAIDPRHASARRDLSASKAVRRRPPRPRRHLPVSTSTPRHRSWRNRRFLDPSWASTSSSSRRQRLPPVRPWLSWIRFA